MAVAEAATAHPHQPTTTHPGRKEWVERSPSSTFPALLYFRHSAPQEKWIVKNIKVDTGFFDDGDFCSSRHAPVSELQSSHIPP